MTTAAPPRPVSANQKTVDRRTPVVFVLVVLALSALVGALWVWLAPPITVTVLHGGDARFSEGASANLFGGVAVFALLSFGLGVVLALAGWFGLPHMRGVPGLILTTVMSVVSSGLALNIGTTMAEAMRPDLNRASPGEYHLTAKLWFDSGSTPPWLLLICAPTTALIVYLICVLTAKNPTLRPDELAGSEWGTQGGELVGHAQAGVGEGVQAGWAPAGPAGAAHRPGGDDNAPSGQNPQQVGRVDGVAEGGPVDLGKL
jgi:hypothetical protein